jgi:diacylglycerol kinase family enzyme
MSELSSELPVGQLEYERIVIAVNPVASAAAKLAGAVEDNLRNGGLNRPVQPLETVAGGLIANQEHFASKLEPGDLVVAVTGDGGFRCVGAAALHPDLAPHRENITFTTVGGGDACDMQHALHGKRNKQSPTELIRNGVSVPILPLSVQVGGETIPAFSYTGFGQSGEGSFTVNAPGYRDKSRLRRETGLLMHAVFKGPKIELEEHHNMAQRLGMEVSDRQLLAELTVSISPYMARNGRFPVHHWDNEMFVMRVKPGILRAVSGLSRLALGHPPGELHPADSLNFTTLSPVGAQFDGEPMRIRAGTEISVGRGAEIFNMLASPCALAPELRQAA